MITSAKALTAGLLLGFFVGAGGAWHFRGVEADNDLLTLRQTFDTASAKAREEGIAEGVRTQTLANDVAAQGRKDDEKIENRGDAVATAAGGLQHDAAVYASSASCDPGVARRGEAATRAAGVLSDLLGQCGKEYSGMAKIADQARARGMRCELIIGGLKARDKSD